jgi:elongation factor 1-alpha
MYESILEDKNKLPPENDYGYIEYKQQLCNLTEDRLKHLINQMKFRLFEGNNMTIYIIGVHDDGTFIGLDDEKYNESIDNLRRMCKVLGANMKSICNIKYDNKNIGEFQIRKLNNNTHQDITIAVLGTAKSGKSTLIGVLTKNELDDGNGLVSNHNHQHIHEIISGNTSSISHHLLGYDEKGNHIIEDGLFEENIIDNSIKVCTLIDLCGKTKYLKTTLNGICNPILNYIFITIDTINGIIEETLEHIEMCKALQIPIIIIITKIDKKDNEIKLEGIQKINSTKEILNCKKILYPMEHSQKRIPLIEVSNVSGYNIDLLKNIINVLPIIEHEQNNEVDFIIYKKYYIDDIGLILSGALISGRINMGDNLLLGPYNDNFKKIKIREIHCNRTSILEARSGQLVSLLVNINDNENIKSGMIISNKVQPINWEFEVKIINIRKDIKLNSEYVIHCRYIKQSAKVSNINQDIITFKFIYKSECLKQGSRIIIRNSKIIGYGIVQ